MEDNRHVNTASASTHLLRIDTLRWTPHMDECLLELANNPEYEGDEILVVLVKLRKIAEKARSCAWQEDQPEDATAKSPPVFHTKILRTELNDIKLRIPFNLQNNRKSLYNIIGHFSVMHA